MNIKTTSKMINQLRKCIGEHYYNITECVKWYDHLNAFTVEMQFYCNSNIEALNSVNKATNNATIFTCNSIIELDEILAKNIIGYNKIFK